MTLTSSTPKHVVIVGGGISGLSAAWYLQQQAKAAGIDLKYTVLEPSERWGGKVHTEHVYGFGSTPITIEAGPDSFMTQKPYALQLAKELGLTDQLLGTNDQMRHVFVLNHGKPVKLPDGVLLIVPTKLMPFALSPLISPLGKLRMGCDLFIPRRKNPCDETLANFVKRRLGSEALDKIAEPLMSGIYNAEADRQSLQATFPRFQQLEQQHNSLIRGMLASRRKPASVQQNAPNTEKPISMFMSLKEGTQGLIDSLVDQLTGDLHLGVGLACINLNQDNTYTLMDTRGRFIFADAVILTTPAYVTAELVRPFAPNAAYHLEHIRYVSTGTVSLVFRQQDLPKPLKGFGVVIPQSEKRSINAVTISSTKFNQRAPEGLVLMRVFFGGSRTPHMMSLEDDKLLRTVRDELQSILGITPPPLLHRIYRWHRSNPQYDVGHLDLVKQIESALPQGLYLTGSAYRGVGLPDCVNQAQQCVQQCVEQLRSTVAPLQAIST